VNQFPTYSPGTPHCFCRRIQWQQTAHRGRSLTSTIAFLKVDFYTFLRRPIGLPTTCENERQ